MSGSQQLLLGGVKAIDANYIEDVFSTWLYTGNGSTQTITNGIDLAGKGGMVWIKDRSAANSNQLTDTVRGATKALSSNTTNAEITNATLYLTAFNNNGFTVGGGAGYNASSDNYASWTFREQPKFFDVVTWTGNSTARSIAHNLGSTPGCIIVKVTNLSGENWVVWHRSINQDSKTQLFLNTTDAAVVGGKLLWGASGTNANMTSTTFSVGTATETNETGNTYVAYLFAHNAGGFGLTGTDNVISCGSYTTGTESVNLGFEPQWLLIKNATRGNYGIPRFDNWNMVDNMRGVFATADPRTLFANRTDAEADVGGVATINATGFTGITSNNDTYIYIAIRRGPMRTPTTGTSVFMPDAYTETISGFRNVGFPPDMAIQIRRSSTDTRLVWDKLRGNTAALYTESTSAENGIYSGVNYPFGGFNNTGWGSGFLYNNSSGAQSEAFVFSRAPGFFDEVCYTGTGVARTVAHNLGVAPELIIFKARSLSGEHWGVWVPAFGFSSGILRLSTNDAVLALSGRITGTSATTVTVGTNGEINNSGSTYVAYLFASCPGVSKVGSYTGTGTTQTINCGFTGGARFVLIKRTDSTGDWYVWDTARGIVAGNDPYLLLNSAAAEVTNTDFIDTASTGFEISSTAPAAINASGGTFVFLAIA